MCKCRKSCFLSFCAFTICAVTKKNSNVLMNTSLSYCHKSTFFWILANLTLFEPETQIIRSANAVFSDFRFPRFSQTRKIWERPYKYLTFSFGKIYFFTCFAKFTTFLGKHPGIPRKKIDIVTPCKTFQKHDSFRSIAAAPSPPPQEPTGKKGTTVSASPNGFQRTPYSAVG